MEVKIIRNFKSVGDASFELDKLTIFIGPPASGKSNIFDALAFIGYFNRLALLDREYGSSTANLEPLSTVARFQEPQQLFSS